MSDFFVGQIKMFGFGYVPKGWAACNGQLLPIGQYSALYALLGVQYGGDGVSTFALPDLRGRTPLGAGASTDANWQPAPLAVGAHGGSETVALDPSQLPLHSHTLAATSTAGNRKNPGNAIFASTPVALYATANQQVTLDPSTCSVNGGSMPHPNMQPYTTVNFCIALQGIFPSRQ